MLAKLDRDPRSATRAALSAEGSEAELGSLPAPSLILLLIGVALAAAPHVPRLPWWLAALAAAILVWRWWAGWKNERLPRRWLLLILVVVGVAAVYLVHRTLFGRDAGVTLLVLFLSLKLMEMKRYRDALIAVFIGYFFTLTNFFYSQSASI